MSAILLADQTIAEAPLDDLAGFAGVEPPPEVPWLTRLDLDAPRTNLQCLSSGMRAAKRAMDLAVGAKRTFVMMEHQTKAGESKIVRECTYPLTGVRCVSRVYTDLATIDITPQGLRAIDIVDGLSLEELARITALPITR